MRCQVRPDRQPPFVVENGAWWQGLALGDGWCATLSSDYPYAGEVELDGHFRHWALDEDRTPTRLQISALHTVVVDGLDENNWMLQELSTATDSYNDFSTSAGWRTMAYIVDARPVPLSASPLHACPIEVGYVGADHRYLWLGAVGRPLVEAYDVATGRFSHRVALASPIGGDPTIRLTEAETAVALHAGAAFPLSDTPIALPIQGINAFIDTIRGVDLRYEESTVTFSQFGSDTPLTSFPRHGGFRIVDATPERIRVLTPGRLCCWTPESGWVPIPLTGGKFAF